MMLVSDFADSIVDVLVYSGEDVPLPEQHAASLSEQLRHAPWFQAGIPRWASNTRAFQGELASNMSTFQGELLTQEPDRN